MPEAIVALGDRKIEVGLLRFTSDGRRQHASFSYAKSWLDNPRAFALAPGYGLQSAAIHSSGRDNLRDALGGPFSDAAPDSWGRRLMARALGEGLTEFDYLVLSDDTTRQGALRFLGADREPLSRAEMPVPRRLDLSEIRAVAARYERDPIGAEEEARFLAGAGASLGGARPKANILDGDNLWIAKFTSVGDTWPVERAEVAVLKIARHAGLRAAEATLELAHSEHPVALIRRFDRRGLGRIPYISARTALQAEGTEGRYYTDIADIIREISVNAQDDLSELWRRMAFSILVNNTDDHLKNHGFVYVRDSFWRLSPAFDINAQPRRAPQMETGISPITGFDPDIHAAIEAAPFFDIDAPRARQIAREMAEIIASTWRGEFRAHGVTGAAAAAYSETLEGGQVEVAQGL